MCFTLCHSNKQMDRVCVLNLSGESCTFQDRTADSQGSLDKSRLCQMSGRSVKEKSMGVKKYFKSTGHVVLRQMWGGSKN